MQVIVNADTLQPVQVHHFVHGYRLGFDMQPERVREVINFEGSAGKEYHGRNYGFDVRFYWLDTSQARADNARSMLSSQNNVLRMMRDQATGEYAHPVVYVEHGGHEFWPRPRLGARKNHRGPPSPGRPR